MVIGDPAVHATGPGRKNMPEVELIVGSALPDFKLPSNMDGEISPSDYRGKKVILFFVREFI
jgi:hypothetical protein